MHKISRLAPGSLRFASTWVVWLRVLVCVVASGSATFGGEAKPANGMHSALASALQANGAAALDALRPLDPSHLTSNDARVRGCMIERLERHALQQRTVEAPELVTLLGIYQEYWLRSLLKEHSASDNDAWLLESLNHMIKARGGSAATTLDDLEKPLESMVEDHGYHSLFGLTRPLREFMLWRTQTTSKYDVALPEGRQTVEVVFMDNFASLGWAGFATCDRVHTGGWTKPDRLYAVRSSYDLDSENFHVSYLAHEGQHFSDQKRFPTLTRQVDLEYRAKLTEVALAKKSLYDLLDSFAGNMTDDDTVPHSFANRQVVSSLCDQLRVECAPLPNWHRFSRRRINDVATALLHEDTRKRALHHVS